VTGTKALILARVRAEVANGDAERIRRSARLTIGEVAAACGVDQSTVWRWEKGMRRPHGVGAIAYGELITALREQVPSVDTTRKTA
jgi:DNA-binding transcriptional regulator YiaG